MAFFGHFWSSIVTSFSHLNTFIILSYESGVVTGGTYPMKDGQRIVLEFFTKSISSDHQHTHQITNNSRNFQHKLLVQHRILSVIQSFFDLRKSHLPGSSALTK